MTKKTNARALVFSLFDNDLSLCPRFVENDLSDRGGCDLSLAGVLHAVDMGRNARLDARFFKAKICVLHLTIDKAEVFAVAKRLCARDPTAHEGEIFRIPAEIFSREDGIVNGDILCVPKGVLRIKATALDDGILNVLEGLFSRKGDVF